VPQYKQVWKTGFPPHVVFSPLTELPNATPVSSVIANRDCIILEAATASELTAAIEREIGDEPVTASPKLASHEGARCPLDRGSSQCSVHGEEPTRCSHMDGPEATVRTAGPAAGTPVAQQCFASPPKPKRRKKGQFPGASRLLADDVGDRALERPRDIFEAVDHAETTAMSALLNAARGGTGMGDLLCSSWTPTNVGLLKALRVDLRRARGMREAEAKAHDMVSAARTGQVGSFYILWLQISEAAGS
jgi:hypothetical protein